MSQVIAGSPDRKPPCALAVAEPVHAEGAAHDPRPCALLCATAPTAPAPAPATPAPREDESADPVGDGHSDADWAAEHPKGD